MNYPRSTVEVIDKYESGPIKRIINFFESEGNQNRLANVIPNDDTLKDQLNYGETGNSLNYLAVAKVGILAFADYQTSHPLLSET